MGVTEVIIKDNTSRNYSFTIFRNYNNQRTCSGSIVKYYPCSLRGNADFYEITHQVNKKHITVYNQKAISGKTCRILISEHQDRTLSFEVAIDGVDDCNEFSNVNEFGTCKSLPSKEIQEKHEPTKEGYVYIPSSTTLGKLLAEKLKNIYVK